jgi:hypothetical protein
LKGKADEREMPMGCSEIKRRRNMMPPPGAGREHVNRKKNRKGKREKKIKLWDEEHSRQAGEPYSPVVTSVDIKGPFPKWQSRCYSRRNENRLGNGKNRGKR